MKMLILLLFPFLCNAQFSVDNFGAVGNGITDDWLAIQTAIDSAIASKTDHIVTFKAKNYKISKPLILAKFNSLGAYVTFNMDLVGSVNANAGITGKCTTITCDFNDTFGIGVQTSRSVIIKNILLVGKYVSGKTYKQMVEDPVWTTTSRDTQFSPYAGITIDPFGPVIPSDGGYPGLSSYYKPSAAGSSGVTVEYCYITNFVVGFSVSNNGTTPNAESINIYNSRIYNTKVALAYGQSQTRACAVRDCAIFNTMTAFDCVNYGASTGTPPVIENIIVSTAKELININANRSLFSGSDIYCENLWRIGTLNPGKNAAFRNCTFKLNYGLTPDFVKAPDSYLVGGGKADFYSCDFTKSGDQNHNITWSDCFPSFYSCSFESNNAGFSNLIFSNYTNCTSLGVNITQGIKFTGPTPGPQFSYNGVELRKSNNNLAYSATHEVEPNLNNSAFLGNVLVTVGTATATFIPMDVSKVKVGDIIYATSTPYQFYFTPSRKNYTPILGTVQSISVTGIVTIKDIPLELTTANFNAYSQWSDKYFGAIFGTTTNGSNVITNIYKESGVSLVGSRIYTSNSQSNPFGVYVISEDAANRTITLSGNWNSTQASIGLYTAYFKYNIIVSVDPSTINGMYVDKGTVIRSRGENLIEKNYLVTKGGIVGNSIHVPSFKVI